MCIVRFGMQNNREGQILIAWRERESQLELDTCFSTIVFSNSEHFLDLKLCIKY